MVARFVRELRERLGLSQSQFGRMVDDSSDGGTVSRWEREILAPHPWKLAKMSEIANKNGWTDIAAALVNPIGNWRSILATNVPELHRLLVLLEICTINSLALDANGERSEAERALQKLALSLRHRLVQHHREGGEVLLADDAQRCLWLDILKETNNEVIGDAPEAHRG